MSNYTQTTFFLPKDSLASGNPAKIIKGADVDPELAAISVAIATKYDSLNSFASPIVFANGSAAAPGVTFTGNTNMGMFRAGANDLGFAVAGAQVADVTSSTWTFAVAVAMAAATFSGIASFADGAAGTPSIAFKNSTGTGIYRVGADIFGIATAGVQRLTINAAGAATLNNATSGPTLTVGDTTSGLNNAKIGLLNFSTSLNYDAGDSEIYNSGTANLTIAAFGTLKLRAGNALFMQITPAGLIQGQGPVAAALVDMTPDKGSFTGTYTGMSAGTTGTVNWTRVGNLVIMTLPALTGTSNSTSFTMTGIPASIQPTTAGTFGVLTVAADNGLTQWVGSAANGFEFTISGGTMTFYKGGTAAGWTATGAKGTPNAQFIHYSLV